MKLPFRLHFDKFEDDYPEIDNQRFHGFQELKLSNTYLDGSLIRDKLMSDTLRDAGLPAAKGGFVEVWVDSGDGSEFWGLYNIFEDPAGEMLDSWFGDDSGNLYKADGDAATLADANLANLQAAFEADGDGADHSDVQALVEILADRSMDAATWRAALEARMDVEDFLSWLALDALIGNWDNYGQMTHNYYLYGDPAQEGRLVWVAWDFNESWRHDGTRPALSVSRDEVGSGWPLIRRLLDDPNYAARYDALLAEHMATSLDVDTVRARMAAYHALVAPYAEAEAAPYTNLGSIRDFEQSLEGGNDALYDHLDEAHALGAAALSR